MISLCSVGSSVDLQRRAETMGRNNYNNRQQNYTLNRGSGNEGIRLVYFIRLCTIIFI